MSYVYNTINNESYVVLSDFNDVVVIDYYGSKLIVTINEIWKRV